MAISDGIRDPEPEDQEELLRQLQELKQNAETLQAHLLRGVDPESVKEIRQQMLNEEAAAKLQAHLYAKEYVAGQEAEQTELNLTTFAQLSSEPISYRIPGILLDKGLLLISGAAKIGKTTFILELIDCLRSGRPFLGLDTKRCSDRIAYLNLEMPAPLLRHYAEKMGIPLDSDRLRVADLNGQASKLQLLNEKSRTHLANQLRKAEVEVLIFDPLSALVAAIPDANSNDNDLMRRVLEAVKALAAEAGIDLVIIIDHTGYEATGRARGASSKQDTPDMLWSIEKLGEDARQLTAGGRVDNPGQKVGFRLSQVTHRLQPVQITDAKSKSGGEADQTLSRIQELYDEHPGWSQRKIADELDINQSVVSRRLKKTKKTRGDA